MDYHPKGKMVLSGAAPYPGGHARIQTDLHAASVSEQSGVCNCLR